MSLPVYYLCTECDTVHDDEEDALDCCAPLVEEIYLCPVCSLGYDREEDAIDCCGWDPDAAGQMRLMP